MIPSNCGAVAAVHLSDFRLDAPVEARILVKLVHMKSNEIAPSMKARERESVSSFLMAERHSNELDVIAISWNTTRDHNRIFFFSALVIMFNHNVLLRSARGMGARISLRLCIT